MAATASSSKGGVSEIEFEPIVGSLSFVPSGWNQIRAGDEVYSASGTKRTIISIKQDQSGEQVFLFHTVRISGEVLHEKAPLSHLSLKNIREVIRRSQDRANCFIPTDWDDVQVGDIIVTDSGTRRLVTGIQNQAEHRILHCLTRGRAGMLDYGILNTQTTKLRAIKELIRFEPAPTKEGGERAVPGLHQQSGTTLPFQVTANVETLLGRGEMGDQFVMELFKKVMGKASQRGEVEVTAGFDFRSGQITGFGKSIHPQAGSIVLIVHDHGPESSEPCSIQSFTRPRALAPMIVLELRRALFISNALKGISNEEGAESNE